MLEKTPTVPQRDYFYIGERRNGDMEVLHTLDPTERAQLVSRKWYHQAFDGCPLIFLYIVEAHARVEPRKENGEARIMLNFFFDGKTDYYLDTADNDRMTRFFVEKSKTDPRFTQTFMARWAADEAQFERICKRIDSTKLDELTTEQLLRLHKEFGEAYMRRVTSSSVIDGFALGSDHLIADRIRAHLRERGRERDYNALFSVLTAPVHISFTNEAEAELLQIAMEIEKDPVLRQLFIQHSDDEIVTKLGAYRDIYTRLVAHQKRFFWLHNNYVDGHILPLEYFILEIKKLLDEGHDLGHDLSFILSHPGENGKKKDTLIRELGLPADLLVLLRYSEDFTHWQDERKKATFFATHGFTLLLEEMARRTGCPLTELKYLFPEEVEPALQGKVPRATLRKRMQEGCMVIVRSDAPQVVLVGTEAADFYERIKRLDVPKDLKLLKGLPASLGKAMGIARVVKSARDISKVNKGDILVAVMTRPDYVVGMKKAAAIVTDEGGLTCHAAIVSRELRLPCVIATKFATHVICDGDRIEVDADHGEVRILERAT